MNDRVPGPIPATCPQCGKPDDGTVRIWWQNTAYVEEIFNYLTCCETCLEENNANWQELWDEYYSGLL